MEEHYRTVQQEQEFLENELKHLENDIEYLNHQKFCIENDIFRVTDLINKIKLELGRK
jgi:hypothetical protein